LPPIDAVFAHPIEPCGSVDADPFCESRQDFTITAIGVFNWAIGVFLVAEKPLSHEEQ
jgi:hypothetical protein